MNQQKVRNESAEIEITNIGGISRASKTIEPGVTLLAGQNATNRTSFLQAVMAVCGSDKTTLKGDAKEGSVELTLNGETYTRSLERKDSDTIKFGGSPYLTDPTAASVFAFLLENNEARRSVAQGDELREIVMQPVDTDEIEREIRQLESERDEVTAELEEIDSLNRDLTDLQQKKKRLEQDIADAKSEFKAKQSEIENLHFSVEEKLDEQEDYKEKVEELSEKRQELVDVERRLSNEQESVAELDSELEELNEKLAETPENRDEKVTEIDKEISNLRGQVQQIESTAADLRSVIQFNEEFLNGDNPDFIDSDQDVNETVTEKLFEENQVVCWTCGTETEASQIKATISQLQESHSKMMEERRTLEDQIDELKDERDELKEEQRKLKELRQQRADVEAEISSREGKITELEERKSALSATVETLEDEIEERKKDQQENILEAQQEANQLQLKVEQLEAELEEVEDEIETIESRLEERESVEARLNQIDSRLTELRTRIDGLQSQAIDSFNEHMSEILEKLEYDNLERIWIDRTEREVKKGRRKVSQEFFNLHVVRSNDSGTMYEDAVEHLSESEREVTGLIFALAGALVHEVYKTVPFMLLDSIEAIDSTRIARLVDYFEGYADYLLVVLLEEDAAPIIDTYNSIESI